MSPRTQSQDGRNIIGAQVLPRLDHLIHLSDGPLEPSVEFGELHRHICGPGTGQAADFDVVLFEPGLAAKPSDQIRIWWNKPPQEVDVPAAGDLYTQRLPAQSCIPDPAE